jgi:large subunit ribosomal protein L16
MLQPKKRKYIKDFRGRRRGVETRGSSLAFGEYGLKALETAWIKSMQIEAARRAIVHNLKKGGRVWIRIFPDKPVSSRPAGFLKWPGLMRKLLEMLLKEPRQNYR